MNHNIPISATFTLFKYLQVSPSVNYTERWYTRKINQQYNEVDHKLEALPGDTLNGFYRVSNYSASLSLSTKLYGMYKPLFAKKKEIQIRHVFTPQVSLSGAPGFSKYWEEYTDYNGNTQYYSPFTGQPYGDSGGNGDLYFYHYDETLPTHADTTLTVWSLADSATARLAVNAYKKANPEVDVTFETAVQTDTDDVSAAINDALTQLNTELLAGEGPDVLLLDRVDYTTYINKGMLADMSDTVPLDALQSNIIDPFMTDGRAYVLPARFIVPALCGDAGTLDGLTDLNDLQDAVLAAAPRPDTEQYSDEYYTALPDDQKYALALASGVDFAKLLLPSSANALLHDGALDADALTKIFTFVKTTADYYGMADYINTEMDGASSQSYDNADIVKIDAQQDEYSTCSRAKFGWMDVATPYAVIAMARTNDIFDADAEAVPVDMIPMPGLTQGAYNPQVLVGVNANSKNPDAAKGLAAAFFGTDVQSQYCSDGTTVRADCLREKLDAVKATVSGAKTGKVTGAYVGDLDAFYANCTTPVLFPVMLQQSFINHAKAIIDGSEDVAAAVAGVQSDLALYLAEQK